MQIAKKTKNEMVNLVENANLKKKMKGFPLICNHNLITFDFAPSIGGSVKLYSSIQFISFFVLVFKFKQFDLIMCMTKSQYYDDIHERIIVLNRGLRSYENIFHM